MCHYFFPKIPGKDSNFLRVSRMWIVLTPGTLTQPQPLGTALGPVPAA